MSIASPEDLKLIEKLIQRGLVERATLVGMLEAQKKAFEESHRTLSGTLYQLEPETGLLRVSDLASKQELAVYPLSASLTGSQWAPWATHRLLVKEDDGTQLFSVPLEKEATAGLVLSREGAWVLTQEGLQADWLGYGRSSLFPGNLRDRNQTGPWDLFFAADDSLFALADRGAGTVDVFSTQNHHKLAHFQVRPAGSHSGLNVAFDLRDQRLIMTDNTSTVLHVGNIATGQIEQIKPGLGMLGNLVMAPDFEHLYLLTLKPAQELLYLKISTWSVSKRIPLKGDLFRNQSEVPSDLLQLSPNQRFLLVMTFQNAPDPLTPVVSVIDTAQVKTLRRYALKDGSRPCQILFARPNPLQSYSQKNLKQMLLESGLVNEQTLFSLEQPEIEMIPPPVLHPSDLHQPQEFVPPPVLSPPVVARKPMPGPVAPAPAQAEPLPPAPPEPEAVKAPSKPSASEISLGPETESLIAKLLAEYFKLETGLEIMDFPRPWKLLQEEAVRIRPILEKSFDVPVELEKLHEGRSLKMTLRRRAVVLRQEQESWLKEHPDPIVPLQCPLCQQNLMNHWECQVCGYELENALRSFKARIASAEATTELENGNFVLPDPQGLRILELNSRKEIVWQLDPDQLSCEFPRDAVRMPDERLLVADSHRHQIYEVGLKGKIHWSMKTFESETHRLKNPVKISWRRTSSGELRYLIVDQGNHRVLEIDHESQICWSFGEQGVSGDDTAHLDSPTDLQFTPDRTWLITDANNGRVLELGEEGELEQIFERESYGLLRPVCAQRLWNGHTLIVDAEAYQILELDPLGVVKERITYYKTGMPTELRLLEPSRLIRLPNQDLIPYNDRKAIQILPLQKKLIWFSTLDKLQLEAAKRSEYKPESAEAPPLQSQESPTREIPVQAAVEPLVPTPAAPKDAGAKFRRVSAQERLQALIQRPTAPKAHLESFDHSVVYTREGASLTEHSPYLIDQRHNGIVRIDRKGRVIWHFGYDLEQRLSRPQFLQVTSHSLVIADTGNNRVIEVSRLDKELLNEIKGPVSRRLNHPRSAMLLKNGNYLIADQYNQRLVEITPDNQTVWGFKRDELIASPQYAEELPDGSILFCDALLNRVTIIHRSGLVKWFYGNPIKGKGQLPGKQDRLFGPGYATRLENGNFLIADTRHHRVLEINPEGKLIWEYYGHARSNRLNPTWLARLENGNTLVSFFNHTRLVELSPKNASVWSYTLGKDVFQPPVAGDEDTLVQHEVEEIQTFYNAADRRVIQTAQASGQEVVELHIELMDGVQMKSVRASLIMMQVEEFGMVIKSFPPPEDLLADRFGRHLVLTCSLYKQFDRDQVAHKVSGIAEVLEVFAHDPDLNIH